MRWLLIALLASCASGPATPTPTPPTLGAWWDPYFEDEHSAFLLGDALRVRLLPHGPPALGADAHLAIAADHPQADRWLQVITVNCTGAFALPAAIGPTWHLTNEEPPWVFVDSAPANRDAEIPFYWDETLPEAQKRRLFDAPHWDAPRREYWPSGHLRWEARAYAVRVDGTELTFLDGLHWGFDWPVGAPEPSLLDPTRLPPESWNDDARLLTPTYPSWRFAPVVDGRAR